MLSFLRLLLALMFTALSVLVFFWGFFISYDEKVNRIRPVARGWSRFMLNKILKIQHHTNGEENIPHETKGFLSVSNHQSFIDILLIISALGYSFLMKSSLLWTPFGWGGHISGALTIDRAAAKSHLRIMSKLIEISKHSGTLHFFPEGTRSKDGEIGMFKKGALKLAFKNQLPILPSGIWGNHLILPKRSVKFNSNYPAVISIGKLIRPQDFSDSDSFIEAVEKSVIQQLANSKKTFDKLVSVQ